MLRIARLSRGYKMALRLLWRPPFAMRAVVLAVDPRRLAGNRQPRGPSLRTGIHRKQKLWALEDSRAQSLQAWP